MRKTQGGLAGINPQKRNQPPIIPLEVGRTDKRAREAIKSTSRVFPGGLGANYRTDTSLARYILSHKPAAQIKRNPI